MARCFDRLCIQLVMMCALAVCGLGCSTMQGARPLEPGQHQAGMTIGGAFVDAGVVVPIPHAIAEGRSGVVRLWDRPLDLNYGLNVTALFYQVFQAHFGASWLLIQESGWRPALSMTNRLYFATNALAANKVEGTRGAWGAHQLELTGSYTFGNQLVYLAFAQYTDFGRPDALLTPALGAEFDMGWSGFRMHVETRWYAINKTRTIETVRFWPGNQGALGLSFGGSWRFD